MQVLPDSMTKGHQAGDSLALLGVVAAQREQLLANVTGAHLLLLAYPVVDKNCVSMNGDIKFFVILHPPVVVDHAAHLLTG